MIPHHDRKKLFEEILSSQSFDLLKDFQDEKTWETMGSEEKDILAQLFLLRAEAEKIEGGTGDDFSFDSYRCACLLSPTSARGWYRLGISLASKENKNVLLEAYDALHTSVSIDAGFFDAQYALASLCLRLAVLTQNEMFCMEAETHFEAASSLIVNGHPRFFWHWGIARFLVAKHSGEPADFSTAYALYEKAASLGLESADFYSDMAAVGVEMGFLLADKQHVLKSISFMEKAIQLAEHQDDVEQAHRYFFLGNWYQYIFDLNREEIFFKRAHDGFLKAISLNAEYGIAHQRFAHLLYTAGILFDRKEFLERVLFHCQQAEKYKIINSKTIAIGSLALLYITEQSDAGEAFHIAEDLAQQAYARMLNEKETFPEVFAALATSCLVLSQYFMETVYIEAAASWAKKGLISHENSPMLWHLLGRIRHLQFHVFDDPMYAKDALVAFSIAGKTSYAVIPSFWNDVAKVLMTLSDECDSHEAAIEAIVAFETARHHGCEVSPAWVCMLASAYDLLGEILEEEHFFEQAIELLEGVLSIMPAFSQAEFQLAIACFQYGLLIEDPTLYDKAIILFKSYLEKEPEDELAYTEYGCVLLYKGSMFFDSHATCTEWFLAEEVFLRAIALGGDRAHYHLAQLYTMMKNYPQAIASLQEAFEKEALPPPEDMMEDELLEPLTFTKPFVDFLRSCF